MQCYTSKTTSHARCLREPSKKKEMSETFEDPLQSTSTAGPSTPISALPASIPSDPVKQFLGEENYSKFPAKNTTPMTLADVGVHEEGIQKLASADLWKEVLKCCERCFQLGFAPHEVLQYRLSHLIALLRLRLYEFAAAQVDSLGDLQKNASYFYQNYPTIYKV